MSTMPSDRHGPRPAGALPLSLVALVLLVPTRAAPAEAGADVLEEVVVTAQKRDETVLAVPISISVLGTQALEQRGIKSLADIARATPALDITSTNGFGYANVSIRGIASATGAATTGFYIDDTPIEQRNDSLGPPLAPQVFDLDRIEVLRGPQGTLYGAGAEGGAVRFITPAPSLTASHLKARGEYAFTAGGSPTWEAGVAGGTPLAEGTLGLRASAWVRDSGGYIDRVDRYSGVVTGTDINGSTARAARVALAWHPAEALTITPSVYFQKTHGSDSDQYWEERPRFQSEAKLAQPNDDRWTLSGLTIDYALPAVTIRSVSSYMSRHNTQVNDWSYVEPSQISAALALGFGVPGIIPGSIDAPGLDQWTAAMHADIDQKVYTQEVRFTSREADDARLSWVGGLFFSRSQLHRVRNEFEDLEALMAAYQFPYVDFFGPVPSLPGPVGYAEDSTSTEKELAAFGNLTLRLADQWKLTLGARVARTEFDSDNFQDGPWNAGPGRATGQRKDTPVTPKANLTWNPSADNMVYAAIARGFRGGGGNASYAGNFVCQIDLQGSDAPAVYKPDTVWSYEVGSKNRLAGGRAELSASVFRIDWSDIQSLIFMPTCGNIYTDNLGKAVSQGADLQLQAQVVHGLTVTLSAGYTDAHYTQTTSKPFGTVALAGERLPIPRLSGSAQVYYEQALAAGHAGYASLAYDYAGTYERNAAGAQVFGADPATADAAAVGSLALRLGDRVGGLDLSAFVDNLTNARPELLRYHETNLSTVYRGTTLRPRTFGVTASYAF